ncbi:hypothetical protein L204_103617 [Cryptococcus depauperatus]
MPTHAKLNVPSLGEIEVPVGLFINNEWVESSRRETITVTNPANGQVLLSFAHASTEDVDTAVKAARKAFKTTWGNNIPAAERELLLLRASTRAKEFGLLAKLTSATLWRVFDIMRALPTKFMIIPWNYPLTMWAWKVAPALAAGCTVVMKPSEMTPLTALAMCDLVKEAGIPAGVINTLNGLGTTVGEAISRHMDIDKVAFTGSVATGRRVAVAAAESNLKKVTLELGGKSPVLVFDSADVEEAADWAAIGIWFNSGQDCCAGSRLYIQKRIYDQFLDALRKRAASCAIGQPHDEKTSFGPLISETQRDKVLNYILSAKEEGARVVTGGQKWPQSNGGYYIEPTILADVTADMKVVKEEIFGPVIVVSSFETEEEALEIANDTSFGLAAAVFTNDTRQATRVSSALDAGTVWINQYMLLHTGVPFGGFKQSGIGRELGTYGLEAYTQVKAVHNNLSQKMSWPV